MLFFFSLVVPTNDNLPKTVKVFWGTCGSSEAVKTGRRHAIGFVRRTSPRRVKTRPLNPASVWSASNAPVPRANAHARTRTKTQHSRQGRGRGLGPLLKVSGPEFVQPGRVPERLPVPMDWPYLAAGVRFSQYREDLLIGREGGGARGGWKERESGGGRKDTSFLILLLSAFFFPPPKTHRRDSVHPIIFFSH